MKLALALFLVLGIYFAEAYPTYQPQYPQYPTYPTPAYPTYPTYPSYTTAYYPVYPTYTTPAYPTYPAYTTPAYTTYPAYTTPAYTTYPAYTTPAYPSYPTTYYPSYNPYPYSGRLISNVGDRVECFFYSENQLLVCRNQTSVIECEAVLQLNDAWRNLKCFGIESFVLNQSLEEVDVAQIRYRLYPRQLENERWLNHTLWLEDNLWSFSLYHAHSNLYDGLRIPDHGCFEDLSYLLVSSQFNQVVSLEQNDVFRFQAANVSLAGDIHFV